MNAYDKILRDELNSNNLYSAETNRERFNNYRRWARAILNGKKAPKGYTNEYNTPKENRLYTLAMVAELQRRNSEYTTINLSEVPYEVSQNDLFVLVDEGLIELYRVAAPYQLVFLAK